VNELIDVKYFFQKKSVKNGIWLYLLQFFNTILPLITIPYITRILGATQYGVFSIVLNIVTYLQVIVEFGFGLSATRKVALSDNDRNLNKLFTAVTCSRLLLYFASMLLVIVYIVLKRDNVIECICLIILAIGLIGYCFQQNWLFQGKQDMKFISISNITARIASTVLIFIFIKTSDDIILYCIINSLSPVASNVIGTVFARLKYKIRFVRIQIADLIATIRDGMFIFFTQLSSKVFGAIGITFLGIFSTDYEVGIYSAIYKIPFMLVLLWSPISQVMYPVTSKKIVSSFEQGLVYIKKLEKIFLLVFGAVAIVVAVLSKTVTQIAFGDEYAPYFYLIFPLLLWMLAGISNNFVGIQILVGSGHDKEYSKCFEIGVLITIALNFILIYFYGINGAAVAPFLSEMSLAVILRISLSHVRKSE
jgi:PST family polysaccharide transporter